MDKTQLLADTDRFYSKLSEEKGMNEAFLTMFDAEGVLLQVNKAPIVGYQAIHDLLMSQNDSHFTLTWEPLFAKVAASADLGYTYGIYKIKDKSDDTIENEGTYTTIWQKNIDNEWKAMLDTGNSGLGKIKITNNI